MYSATNLTGATGKTDTLRFKEMFSFFLLVYKLPKPNSFVVNMTCDWLINVGWPWLSLLRCNLDMFFYRKSRTRCQKLLGKALLTDAQFTWCPPLKSLISNDFFTLFFFFIKFYRLAEAEMALTGGCLTNNKPLETIASEFGSAAGYGLALLGQICRLVHMVIYVLK